MLIDLRAAHIGLLAQVRHSAGFLQILSTAARAIACRLERRRQLQALSDLDDHHLRDIGLTRADVQRVCLAPSWVHRLGKPQRRPVRLVVHAAVLLFGFFIALGATRSESREICKPSLLPKTARHSDVADLQRRWIGVFAVDAARCSTRAGSFAIAFVRLKESGPDLAFTESFTWHPDQVEVSLDLWWDEWVNAYRIGEVAPCSCQT